MEQDSLILLHEQNLLRQGLARLLADVPRYHLLAQVADVPALKRALALGQAPRLLLLSAGTATAEHCGLLRWLHAHFPLTGLLLLGDRMAPGELFNALCTGAHGYLCTQDAQERLFTMLEHITAGAVHFPAEVYALLGHLRTTWEPTAQAPTLTRPLCPSHTDFLRWLLVPGDLTYPVIGKRMGKHPRIIKGYSDDLRKRFQLHSKNDLIRLAQQLGLERMGPPVAVG